jgi:D-3-phosphoglycerate dehydrogenase / 2-oxoglutarate reductase
MRILVAEKSSFSLRGLESLGEIAPVEALDLTQTQLVQAVPDYEILVVRLGLKVDQPVLAAGQALRVVGTPTTGLDHINLQAAQERGVAVLSLKGERAFLDQVYATAEHTIALLLSLVRNIPAAFEAVKSYEWRRDLYRGRELSGKALGIVGCGRLGSMVARYAAAFGMRVLVYDPYQTQLPDGAVACSTLAELLAECDVLSIHVPLNPETEGMLAAEQLAQLRPGAILINTARGAVLDETALLHAMDSGRLAGAAVDVICNEHAVGQGADNPLIEYARTHDNLIITPHIGGATQESIEKADLFIANKIREYLYNL